MWLSRRAKPFGSFVEDYLDTIAATQNRRFVCHIVEKFNKLLVSP